jgi:propionyl-CoA carboxylase alpha chain
VESGSVVSPHYDPLLAKVIASAPTRAEAAARLGAALAGARLHGVAPNRDLLVQVLRHPEFLAGRTDTAFLERHAAEVTAPLAGAADEEMHALAAALAGAAARRAQAPVLAFAPSGWRNNLSQPQRASFEGRRTALEVEYAFRSDGAAVSVNGQARFVRVGRCTADGVDLEVDGIRRTFEVHAEGALVHVDGPGGSTTLRERDRFPAATAAAEAGSLRAPLPGVVVRVGVEPGQLVEAGAVVAVIEAMKMEHPVAAPHEGRVAEMRVHAGQAVDAGYVLAVIEPAEAPSA